MSDYRFSCRKGKVSYQPHRPCARGPAAWQRRCSMGSESWERMVMDNAGVNGYSLPSPFQGLPLLSSFLFCFSLVGSPTASSAEDRRGDKGPKAATLLCWQRTETHQEMQRLSTGGARRRRSARPASPAS